MGRMRRNSRRGARDTKINDKGSKQRLRPGSYKPMKDVSRLTKTLGLAGARREPGEAIERSKERLGIL